MWPRPGTIDNISAKSGDFFHNEFTSWIGPSAVHIITKAGILYFEFFKEGVFF